MLALVRHGIRPRPRPSVSERTGNSIFTAELCPFRARVISFPLRGRGTRQCEHSGTHSARSFQSTVQCNYRQGGAPLAVFTLLPECGPRWQCTLPPQKGWRSLSVTEEGAFPGSHKVTQQRHWVNRSLKKYSQWERKHNLMRTAVDPCSFGPNFFSEVVPVAWSFHITMF